MLSFRCSEFLHLLAYDQLWIKDRQKLSVAFGYSKTPKNKEFRPKLLLLKRMRLKRREDLGAAVCNALSVEAQLDLCRQLVAKDVIPCCSIRNQT